jgi:hypothetical protein
LIVDDYLFVAQDEEGVFVYQKPSVVDFHGRYFHAFTHDKLGYWIGKRYEKISIGDDDEVSIELTARVENLSIKPKSGFMILKLFVSTPNGADTPCFYIDSNGVLHPANVDYTQPHRYKFVLKKNGIEYYIDGNVVSKSDYVIDSVEVIISGVWNSENVFDFYVDDVKIVKNGTTLIFEDFEDLKDDFYTSGGCYYYGDVGEEIYDPNFTLPNSPENSESPIWGNLRKSPGFLNRDKSPWREWESSIRSSAYYSLKKNFSDPSFQRDEKASCALKLATAFWIYNTQDFARKTKEALMTIDIGNDNPNPKTSRAKTLMLSSIAYSVFEPFLTEEEKNTIRSKIMEIGEKVYIELNDNGTSKDYLAFSDYHGQAYPSLGIAGVVFNKSEWIDVATRDLFENDTFHTIDKGLFYVAVDDEGTYFTGSYKSYVINAYLWLANVYKRCGIDLLERYPILKKFFLNELWSTLPNRYTTNYCTYGNMKTAYQKTILSLQRQKNHFL